MGTEGAIMMQKQSHPGTVFFCDVAPMTQHACAAGQGSKIGEPLSRERITLDEDA